MERKETQGLRGGERRGIQEDKTMGETRWTPIWYILTRYETESPTQVRFLFGRWCLSYTNFSITAPRFYCIPKDL